MDCGKWGVTVMALLDEANTGRYGHPEPTQVNIGVVDGPGILISGHDLRDLEDLLEQTAGAGINVYTHGEMLPAHAYPFFKKYPHLVANYGGAWWQQQKEFAAFNGPIVMTSNCLQKPLAKYADRVFTTGMVGWENTPHIADREPGGRKDFSAVIAKAHQCDSPAELENGMVWTGFARQAIMDRAEAVVSAVQSGAIKRFVVMAGCDGRQPERQYYTDVAAGLPKDAVILTAGCAKFRYNKLELGDIGGIPRVLDAGQCNDSYSLVMVALKLAEVFGVDSVNDLPISYDIAWYEQKAVLVLLSLLYLNVQKIHLGPTLPAFLSPNVTNLLVEKFDLRPINNAAQDIEIMMLGQ
jgi:hydroxylamine reductase